MKKFFVIGNKVSKSLSPTIFNYWFKKYNIDSLQFFESELYYLKNPKLHNEIYSQVKIRILKSMDSLKSIDSLKYIN